MTETLKLRQAAPPHDVRLLALDLDGTTLNQQHVIPLRLKQRLKRLKDLDCRVVLASGRMVASMARYAQQLELAGPAAAYNGAVIARLPDGEVLEEHPVPLAVTHALCAFCREAGIYVQLYHQDRVYAERRDHPQARRYEEISGSRVHGAGRALYVPDRPPTKVLLAADEAQMPGLQQQVQERFGTRVQAVTSYPFYLEIVALGVDKGGALARLCRRLGVSLNQTVAVGDGANDVPLLERAGLGIAVADAHPALLARADAVAPAAGPDGVLAVLDRLWPLPAGDDA